MKINKERMKRCAKTAGATVCFLCVFTAFYLAGVFVSCKITPEGIELATGDFSAPELLEFTARKANEIAVSFSEEVRITNVHITSETDGSVFESARSSSELSPVQTFTLARNMTAGDKYRFSGVAEDRKGNSLSFSVGFSGYNPRVPILILSEIRSEYSSSSATNKKIEFVELYAVTGGNLAGVTVFSANDGSDCVYEFPPCEVSAGEYIVLHYRKLSEDCVDETGGNLVLSGGIDATAARDFWVNNTAARIGKSDVILLRERAGGNLLDAVLYSETTKTSWKNDVIRKAAEEAAASGLWTEGSAVSAAVVSDKLTATRTLGRQNIPAIAASRTYSGNSNGKTVWLVTQTSSASPGDTNSSIPAE
jgi:hypothetical protein